MLYEVLLQTLRGFHGHLNTVLQDRDREKIARHARQPEPEIRIYLRGVEIVHVRLQLRHIGLRQVTVLQHHPGTVLQALIDGFVRLRTLTLSQSQQDDPLPRVQLVGQLQKTRHRVRSHREHKQQRHVRLRLLVAHLEKRVEIREGRRIFPYIISRCTIKSKGGGSKYAFPSFSWIMSWMHKTTPSGRNDRRISACSNAEVSSSVPAFLLKQTRLS